MRNVALYFAKFLITAYTSILPPLLPVLMRDMNLSLTQAGGLVSFFSLFNSILQPLFGWVEDRLGYRRFLCLSPLWVGLFLGALGFARRISGRWRCSCSWPGSGSAPFTRRRLRP